jgi:hypothetical protein
MKQAHDLKIGTVQNWLKTQATFFSQLKKLAKHWNQCVEVKGDKIKK